MALKRKLVSFWLSYVCKPRVFIGTGTWMNYSYYCDCEAEEAEQKFFFCLLYVICGRKYESPFIGELRRSME